MKKLTYAEFGEIAITLAQYLPDGEREAFTNKAKDLIKANASKGVSKTTIERGGMIRKILGKGKDFARTAAEINAELGTDFTALQISGYLKHTGEIQKTTVIREVVDSRGLKNEREYVAYYL